MFEVKVGGLDQLLKKFDTFSKQIEELNSAWPDELVAWQRDDMHRKFPNDKTDVSGDETSSTTLIWPHSRLETQEERARRQSKRGPKQYRVARDGPAQHRIGGGRVMRSTRPILRNELRQKLQDRMVALAAEALKWP